MYSDRVRAALSPKERQLFSKLNSPQKIQTFLDSIPINFESGGETNHSPRSLLNMNKAHCFEGAVFAAAVLGYHGQKPLLMDFATAYDDEDHTIALFKQKGRWGAISKTNHSILRYRDPVYKTLRELAMSYFHEYFMWDGRKSLRAYSRPFDLSHYAPVSWVTDVSLDWLMGELSKTRYVSVAPPANMRKLRRASSIERKALALIEWKSKNQR